MTPAQYEALQQEILQGPKAAQCAPHVLRNLAEGAPKVPAAEVRAKDGAIAAILSEGRTRVVSRIISERGIREKLEDLEGASVARVLRQLSESGVAPAWLEAAMTAAQVPAVKRWATYETLKSAWHWLLTNEGLDLGGEKPRALLRLIVLGHPDDALLDETERAFRQALASGAAKLADLARMEDPVSAADVSRALRGPWE